MKIIQRKIRMLSYTYCYNHARHSLLDKWSYLCLFILIYDKVQSADHYTIHVKQNPPRITLYIFIARNLSINSVRLVWIILFYVLASLLRYEREFYMLWYTLSNSLHFLQNQGMRIFFQQTLAYCKPLLYIIRLSVQPDTRLSP